MNIMEAVNDDDKEIVEPDVHVTDVEPDAEPDFDMEW